RARASSRPRRCSRRGAARSWAGSLPRVAGEGRGGGGIEDLVAVALLEEEALPPRRHVLLARLVGHERVEDRAAAVLLGPEDAAEALRLLLTRAVGARELDRDARVGEVDREVGHLRDA